MIQCVILVSGFFYLIFLRCISVVACIRTSFPFMAIKYSTVLIYHMLFIHSSVDRNLNYFQLWLLGACFKLFFYIHRSGIVGSNSNFMFKYLRKHQTVFYSSCTLYSPISIIWGFWFLHIFANIRYCLSFCLCVPEASTCLSFWLLAS